MNKIKVISSYHPYDIQKDIDTFINQNLSIEIISVTGYINKEEYNSLYITYILYKDNVKITQALNESSALNPNQSTANFPNGISPLTNF